MLTKKTTPLGKNPTTKENMKPNDDKKLNSHEKRPEKLVDKWTDDAKQDSNIGGG